MQTIETEREKETTSAIVNRPQNPKETLKICGERQNEEKRQVLVTCYEEKWTAVSQVIDSRDKTNKRLKVDS